MHLTFLTPRLPPMVCGLADHTEFLAQALRQKGIDVSFIYCHWQQSDKPKLNGSTTGWDGRPMDLLRCLERRKPDWLWIQLSGYGFSRWGAPYRLGLALRRFRKSMPHIRLAICLHEVHCKPWQLGLKGALLSPWQKHTVGEIARLGDFVFTSNDVCRQWAIQDYAVNPRRAIKLPIGSHIPDLVLTARERSQLRRGYGWDENEFVAVAFGSFGSQIRALRDFGPFLNDGFEKGILDRVICLGGECSEIPDELNRLGTLLTQRGTCQIIGNRPARDIGEFLACCDLGLCATPLDLVEKSSAFIASAWAGLAVLTSTALSKGQGISDKLPVFPMENWDWHQARSPLIEKHRLDVRRYAEANHRWSTIADQALAWMCPEHQVSCNR